MCEPASATLATASLIATAAGTAVSVYGAIQQGQAQKSQANYQAAVSRNNQIIADRQAADAEARGRIEEQAHRRKVAALAGRQRAVLAGNGVVVDQGSALDIVGDTYEQGELDALTIRSNAEREAYGHRVQASNFGAEAGLATMRGKAASQAGYMNAAGSLLSGAGSVANKWYGFKREGVY